MKQYSPIVIYFFVAALTVAASRSAPPANAWEWFQFSTAMALAGLIAVKAKISPQP